MCYLREAANHCLYSHHFRSRSLCRSLPFTDTQVVAPLGAYTPTAHPIHGVPTWSRNRSAECDTLYMFYVSCSRVVGHLSSNSEPASCSKRWVASYGSFLVLNPSRSCCIVQHLNLPTSLSPMALRTASLMQSGVLSGEVSGHIHKPFSVEPASYIDVSLA